MTTVHKFESHQRTKSDLKVDDTDISQSALNMLQFLQSAHERLRNALVGLDLSASSTSNDPSKISNLSRSSHNAQTAYEIYGNLKNVLTNLELSCPSDQPREKTQLNVSPSDDPTRKQEQAYSGESGFRDAGSDTDPDDNNRLIGWHACRKVTHSSPNGTQVWEIWRWGDDDGSVIGRVPKLKHTFEKEPI